MPLISTYAMPCCPCLPGWLRPMEPANVHAEPTASDLASSPAPCTSGPAAHDYSWEPLACSTHEDVEQRFAGDGEYAEANLMLAIPSGMLVMTRTSMTEASRPSPHSPASSANSPRPLATTRHMAPTGSTGRRPAGPLGPGSAKRSAGGSEVAGGLLTRANAARRGSQFWRARRTVYERTANRSFRTHDKLIVYLSAYQAKMALRVGFRGGGIATWLFRVTWI